MKQVNKMSLPKNSFAGDRQAVSTYMPAGMAKFECVGLGNNKVKEEAGA